MSALIYFTTIELISIVLVAILIFLGFKILETNWSYRISKPWSWDEAVKQGTVAKGLIKIERVYRDKVRFYTFWIQINRLKRDHVKGSFAEVGVYRGETARIIHAMDNTRKFYLFDSFKGFPESDLRHETLRAENRSLDFSDTSEEVVKECVRGNENLIFCAGDFPETAKDIDDRFSLVSLDADLYLPTLAGLQYFYPRLEPGGVILIHDYNHTWDGIKKAVDEFMKGIPEPLIEVADWQGSAMIIRTLSQQNN